MPVTASGDLSHDAVPITQREVERKVLLPADATLPVLAGVLPGVVGVVERPAVTLVAEYHDTVDLRLARWGVTLRRRAGGADEGWHLKLPVASDVRDELRLPLAAGEVGHVPGSLADTVLALVRGEPIVPVATVTTLRSAQRLVDATGVELAELVDDRVRLVRGGEPVGELREVEVEARDVPERGVPDRGVGSLLDAAVAVLELAGGTPSSTPKAVHALGRLASQPPDVVVPPWPTRDEPAGATLTCVLASGVRTLLLADVGVRRDLPDSVHQMRVAARSLRSALRTFASLVDAQWSSDLRDELRWVADSLATIRDAEVQRARLTSDAGLLGPRDGALAAAAVLRLLDARVEEGRAAAMLALRSERYVQLLDALVDAARDPRLAAASGRPAGRTLKPLVRTAARRLRASVEGLQVDDPPQDWHRVRILAKRARYAAQTTAPVLGERVEHRAGALAQVTDVLGEAHDAATCQVVLRELVTGVDGPTAFALGRLHEVEVEAERRERARFAETWPDVERALRTRRRH